jgi:hypothetical protein
MHIPKTMRGMLMVALALVSGAGGLSAQKNEVAGPEADFTLMKEKIWMAAELSYGTKPIKGAPYSAQAVKEIEQVLIDGNRIYRRTTSSIYRDSEGRTRHEQSPMGIGPFPAGDETLVFINDPVASVTYVLEPRSRSAKKSTQVALAGQPGEPVRAGMAVFGAAGSGTAAGGSVGGIVAGAGPAVYSAHMALGGPPAEAVFFKARSAAGDNVRRESLGKQLVEGVEAEGTRTVITIPAGQIGNERAIEIVSERWYSDELAAVIMSREIDPRSGETRYRLTNLSRAEPPHSLFEVPSDYTIHDAGPHHEFFQMSVPRSKFAAPKP